MARALDIWPNFSKLGSWTGMTKEFAFISPIAQDELKSVGHVPLSWPFPDGYPDIATNWVNANYQVMRWNIYGYFVRGQSWSEPNWTSLMPVREANVDKQINVVADALLHTDLGSADKTSIKNAVTKTFGSNPDFSGRSREINALISRLIFQLPVWSLR